MSGEGAAQGRRPRPKLKASCPTLLSIGWFKENLPTTSEEETAVEEAGEKPGGEVTAEDMATEEVEESGSE